MQIQLKKCGWMNNPPLVCAHGGDSTNAFPNTVSSWSTFWLSSSSFLLVKFPFLGLFGHEVPHFRCYITCVNSSFCNFGSFSKIVGPMWGFAWVQPAQAPELQHYENQKLIIRLLLFDGEQPFILPNKQVSHDRSVCITFYFTRVVSFERAACIAKLN